MSCARSLVSPITGELGLIRETIAQHTNEHGLFLSQDRSRALLRRLEKISQLVTNLEREISVRRIGEQNRAAAGIMEGLASEFLSGEASEVDLQTGNVLFGDFEKGGKS
ncbi:hypothetical protein [uncultured Cohaesibacter sp.]|uniref:hypothetical protein n=1 Tax=uncultured Cohaesibacter sp. TaxID=1002546 RepID=UPI002AAA75AA|nr:hypothetical protein [uncultured Cohaesibacter sp.]